MRKSNVIITGTSSGLGLATAKALGEFGKWHVGISLRPKKQLKSVGIPKDNYTLMHLGLASLDSVRNTAGNVPPKVKLGDLRGLAGGLNEVGSSSMIDSSEFDAAKAYKESKVCKNSTHVTKKPAVSFASLNPSCIAEMGLFREHIPLFRLLFPPFQKYITKDYVKKKLEKDLHRL